MLVFSLDLKNEENPCGLVTREEMHSNLRKLRESICNHKMKVAMGKDGEGNVVNIVFTDDFKETDVRHFEWYMDGCAKKIPFHPIVKKEIPQIMKAVKKIIRKAEEKEMMKETNVMDLAAQKEADKEVSTVVDIEVTSQAEVDVEPVVESHEENDIEQEQAEAETESKVVSTEQPAEDPLQKLIPPIKVEPLPKTEEVIKTEDGSIFLQVMVDAASGIVTGCQYYRVDENGVPMLSSDTLVKISKSRIESSIDHTILYILRNFNLKITEDNIKEAFDKSKEMIRDQSRRTVTGGSDIVEIYREMMRLAISEANAETEVKGIQERHFVLTADYIAIRTNWLEKVLEMIEPVNRKRFLYNLSIIETQMKTKIIISNRTGGYAYNSTGNVRYYRFTRRNALGNF